jgi:hypothetical protein
MRIAPLVFVGLALASEAFAWWGLTTTSGRRAFDEMAGMIPLAAGAIGVVFALAALVAWWRVRPR